MSCQNIEDVRIIVKYSSFPGETPTIPNSANHEDGTWLPTDIYIGEMFINAFDNKAWVRGIDGIFPLGATGGTVSFIGDFVHASTGGTFSGPITSTTLTTGTVSTVSITASNIFGDIITANYFIGDGSGLTNIQAVWNGGTVSNPVLFLGDVVHNGQVQLNSPISSSDATITANSNIEVINGYGVSASYFIGDGSGLTNLPVGTYSNYYTTNSVLSGNTIVFDRTDTAGAYSVDLTPILATDSIAAIAWNSPIQTLEIFYTSGYQVSTPIDVFQSLTTNTLSANFIYGGEFYGSFNGTFSGTIEGDIYTTGATLSGTTIDFSRTDGTTYSVDLASLSGAGGTQSLSQTLAVGNTTGTNNIILSIDSAITNEDGTNGYTFVENGDYYPKIYTNAGTNANWITVEDSETWLRNEQVNPGFTDRYGQTIMSSTQIVNSAVDNISGDYAQTTLLSYQIETAVVAGAGPNLTETIQTSNNIQKRVDSGYTATGSSTFDMFYNETVSKTDVENDGGYNTLSAGQRTYNPGDGSIGSEITTSNTTQGMYANIYNWFDPSTAAVENIFSITAANPYGASYVTNITQRKDEIKVQGNVGTFRGIEYVDDYSADFTGNSLVTKDWVLSNSSQSLTDTVCNRTDEIFVDASGGEYECNPYIYPTISYTTIRSAMSGATAAIYVDPDTIRLNVVEIPGSYESEITITDEILTMYGGRSDVDNQTTWGIELGTEVRRYRYTDPTTPWGTPDKFEEKRFVLHKKFTSETAVPGQMDLYYENFEQEAINDFEIDFYIMNNETYGPQRKYMTKSYKRRVHYDNYNSATILIPDETKEGDTLNPAYESWSITTQSSIYGTKYVLDWNLDGAYDYSVTIVVKHTAKKY